MAAAKEVSETASGQSSVGRTYDCPICLEQVKTPRGLPCLHTFCEDCLHSYITAAASKDANKIECPVCRKQISEPEGGLPVDKWAKCFPLNYFILSVSPMQADDNTNNAKGDTCNDKEICKFCIRANKEANAEHFCKNCAEAMCDVCKTFHGTVPALKSHAIVSLQMYRDCPTIPETDEVCQNHPKKVIEVFCVDHRKLCCSICFATQHRHCKDVKSLDECEASTEESSEFIENLDSLDIKLEKEIKGKVKLIDTITKSKESAVLDMMKSVEAMKKNLDILLETFEGELNSEHATNLAKVENTLHALRGVKASVVCDQQLLKALSQHGTKKQMFVAIEKVKSQLQAQQKIMSDIVSATVSTKYEVEPTGIQAMNDVKTVGSINRFKNNQRAVTKDIVFDLARIASPTSYLHVDPEELAWSKQWSCSVSAWGYGATFLGNRIAVVSKDEGLIIWDEDGSNKQVYSIPYPMTPVNVETGETDEHVFVSFKKQKILKKYQISRDELSEIDEIHFQEEVEGFCILGDFIVHAARRGVHISDITGKLLGSFSANLKGNVGFLCGSIYANTMYYIDGNTLVCRTAYGEELKKTELVNSMNHRGIGIDFQNNVYICNNAEKKLQQVRNDTFTEGRCLNGVSCYTIAFHPDGMSFVVVDNNHIVSYYKLLV